MPNIYKFSDVEAKNAKPSTLREIIKEVLRADNDECADEMQPYLMEDVCGSKEYDHAKAVFILLEHDSKKGGRIHVAMRESHINERKLWDELVKVYKKVGYEWRNGKISGLLEYDENNSTSEVEA